VNLQSTKFDAVKRPVTLITAGSVLLLALLWWFLWMSPQGNKLTTVTNQNATLSTQLQTLHKTLETDIHQSAKVNLYAGYLKMFSTAVPEVPDAGGLTTELSTLADSIAPSLIITTLTDDSTVPGTPLGLVPLSLDLTGPRQDCFTFLADLYNPKKIARLITISSFVPTPASGGSTSQVLKPSNQMYNVAIVGDAYYDADIDPGLPGTVTTTVVPT
jgi:Tfp pilus assembly protein PilO